MKKTKLMCLFASSAWLNVLNQGQSREHVFNSFADSIEFKKLCASYGIQ